MKIRVRPAFSFVLLVGSVLVLAQCGGASPTAPQSVVEVPIAATPAPIPSTPSVPEAEVPVAPPPIPPPGTATASVNVLGDTGWCGAPAMASLATLFGRFDGAILLAGDLAYPNGAASDYRNCFDPAFGRFKPRMRTSPGNHDYNSSASAQHYFDYFGDRSGPNRLGYYAFREGEWTVLMLNSNVPTNRTSPQYAFVRTTMQQTPTRCTMAVMHHPFDSSSVNGPTPSLRDLWELLYNLGADLVVAGHDHVYERFAPADASGRRDDVRGIRQFTAGTGGATLYGRMRNAANSELLLSTYGMLRLKLEPALYEWTFMDINGSTLDRGLNVCH